MRWGLVAGRGCRVADTNQLPHRRSTDFGQQPRVRVDCSAAEATERVLPRIYREGAAIGRRGTMKWTWSAELITIAFRWHELEQVEHGRHRNRRAQLREVDGCHCPSLAHEQRRGIRNSSIKCSAR